MVRKILFLTLIFGRFPFISKNINKLSRFVMILYSPLLIFGNILSESNNE